MVALKRLNLTPSWIPLRVKITLPYLILALLVAVGAGYLLTQVVFDTIEERFTNQLIESSKLASERMVNEENKRLESLRLLANGMGISEALSSGNAEQLRLLAYPIAVNHQEEAVEFLNTNGELILFMRHTPGGNIEEYDFGKKGGTVFKDYEFVNHVLNGNVDVQGDKYSGVALTSWGNYFYIAGPIYDEQRNLVGVVLVGKTLETLAQQIRQETLAQVTLYNQAGQALASTFLAPQNLSQALAEQAILQKDETSLRRHEIVQSNIRYDELAGVWQGRNTEELGVIGVSLAQTFLVQANRITRVQITMLVAVVFLAIIFLGITLADRITRPVQALMNACRQVASGNLETRVAMHSKDEVEFLANSFNDMVARLRTSRRELMEAYDTTLEGWAKALELRDQVTEGHTSRVADVTVELAKRFNLEEGDLAEIRRGALLHDIGKMGIPDSILQKPGPLTSDEWVVMHQHPELARRMLESVEFLSDAVEIPFCHHEHWDGTGYPRGLKGEEIPISARIFSVVDVWDALRSDRPYRKAMPDEEAWDIIYQGKGSMFDPRVVDEFIAMNGLVTVM